MKGENERLRKQLAEAEQTSIEHKTSIQNQYESRITEINNRYVTIENKYTEMVGQNKRLDDLLREKDETIRRLTEKVDSQEAHSKNTYNSYIEANQRADDLRR